MDLTRLTHRSTFAHWALLIFICGDLATDGFKTESLILFSAILIFWLITFALLLQKLEAPEHPASLPAQDTKVTNPREASEEATASVPVPTALINKLAHDIKAPISGISTVAHLLKSSDADSAKILNLSIERLEACCDQLKRLAQAKPKS